MRITGEKMIATMVCKIADRLQVAFIQQNSVHEPPSVPDIFN